MTVDMKVDTELHLVGEWGSCDVMEKHFEWISTLPPLENYSITTTYLLRTLQNPNRTIWAKS